MTPTAVDRLARLRAMQTQQIRRPRAIDERVFDDTYRGPYGARDGRARDGRADRGTSVR